MAQIGDTVRFLNDVGGGVITKIDGKIVYVEENGFETPVLISDVVVVLPAGHQPDTKGAKLMFDQKAFDEGKKENRSHPAKETGQPEITAGADPEFPIEETPHGEAISITLAFEPKDIKALSKTRINALLVNDSNYFLAFDLLSRDDEEKAWRSVYHGEIAPNELIDLASYTQETISAMERVVFQAIAYKKGKAFQVKSPINISKKIDLTKFYKAHCFRPGVYFDNPVIEIPLYSERTR